MKRGLQVLVMVGLVASMGLPAFAANDEWEFHGGGWGHGVGMPQFGAQGMALAGKGHEEILGYYYKDATVKSLSSLNVPDWLSDPEALWVGLVSNQSSRVIDVTAGQGFALCVAGDGSSDCGTPDLVLGQGDQLTVSVSGVDPLRCVYTSGAAPAIQGDCWADVSWDQDAPGSRRLRIAGIQYARGTLRIRPNRATESAATGFHVSLTIGVEKYLYGIAEAILEWQPAALEAQAVAARSYGVITATERDDPSTGLPNTTWINNCWCHLRRTTADQAYSGWSGGNPTEGDPTHGLKWRNAVNDTDAKVVTHASSGGGNIPVKTFYFSSSGGSTEDVEEVFNGSSLAWLRATPDPFSGQPGNGNGLANWTVNVPAGKLADHFGWQLITDIRLMEAPPAARIRFTGKLGGQTVNVTLSGSQVRPILEDLGYRPGGTVRVSPYIDGLTYTGRFIDSLGHLFEQEIAWLANEGITKGCNPPINSNFCPGSSVTRGQMAAFLTRFLDLPASSSNTFTDDNGHLFEVEINAMAAAGITKGCNPPANTRFCPDAVIDRGQLAALLVRALGLPSSSTDHFSDDNSSIFQSEINALAQSGITRGCNPPANTHFCPTAQVTRGQMAAFLMRAAAFVDD